MSEFNEKLRLKEKAEEDMYFARRDRELIRAMHEAQAQEGQQKELPADASSEQTATKTAGQEQPPERAGGYFSQLIARALRWFRCGAK